MKTVFNTLICLAVLALSVEIVADFFVTSDWNTLKTELSENDDTDDSDESEEEEGEEEVLKEKELFYENLQPLSIAVILTPKKKIRVQCEHPDEFHLKAPLYSPPEVM